MTHGIITSGKLFFLALAWLWWPLLGTTGELTVFVSRNRTHPESGVVKQVMTGNSSTDTVIVEYKEPDGTLITFLTDFRTNAHIVRLIIPGEEELLEPKAQTICFISFFNNDLISPEAVMKLRQKHPGTIRVADEDLGEIVQDSAIRVHARSSAWISSHLSKMCKESAYSSKHELFNILHQQNDDLVGKPEENYENLRRCFSIPFEDMDTPCICSRQVWLNWMPCALKYCRNKDGEGEHRCGIKTCQKCMTYRFMAKSKAFCPWDEP